MIIEAFKEALATVRKRKAARAEADEKAYIA